MLWFFSRRDVIKKARVWSAIVGDELWVIGTLILILGFPSALNTTGKGVAAIGGLVVGGFATGQFIGIRRMSERLGSWLAAIPGWAAGPAGAPRRP